MFRSLDYRIAAHMVSIGENNGVLLEYALCCIATDIMKY